MNYSFEKELPNLADSTISKISSEFIYQQVQENGNVLITGKLIIKREIKSPQDHLTEIIDYIPVEVEVSNKRIIDSNQDISVYLNEFDFSFNGDKTKFLGNINLTNVKEKEDQLIFTPIFEGNEI